MGLLLAGIELIPYFQLPRFVHPAFSTVNEYIFQFRVIPEDLFQAAATADWQYQVTAERFL